eukprot:CAMPEP_0173301178 /NCGR_PEP_ID=MMETSP1143-20121109/17647_1 /TAXON_ID=483371 /ORGANISM="non described non described, Strain CCMP2298" /LENGTH=110 /DNA_ID=CAMNT_0014241663 /DNA_START=31 /DNA_END=359 /DNA_ORIENTATION=+
MGLLRSSTSSSGASRCANRPITCAPFTRTFTTLVPLRGRPLRGASTTSGSDSSEDSTSASATRSTSSNNRVPSLRGRPLPRFATSTPSTITPTGTVTTPAPTPTATYNPA